MPDENGNALPGEPEHWRYKKEQGIAAHGTTTMAIFSKKKKPEVEEKEKPKEAEEETKKEEPKKLTEKELIALTKAEQIEMLKKLTTDEAPRYEKQRVELLLKLQ